MAFITLLKSTKPKTLGKRFELNAEGKITKNAIANVWEGETKALDFATVEEFAERLMRVCEASEIALMSGRFLGAELKEVVNLVTERKLSELLGCELQNVPGGVQIVREKKFTARLKRGIEQDTWVLIDADNPEGIPPKWAAMGMQQRLEMLEPVVPGISACTRVEYRSSSARVVKVGDQPGGATHAWIQISDAAKLEIMREHVKVQMVLQGLSFASPRHSWDNGAVIGAEERTVIDIAVWVLGRLAFCSKPEVVAEGYCVEDAGVQIINPDGGLLDVSDIELPSKSDLELYRKKTGKNVSYSTSAGLAVNDIGTLTLETPIEVKGKIKTFGEWVADMEPGGKLRCETPFRASSSEAAFIRLKDDGVPFLHDTGTSTIYFLSVGDEVRLRTEDPADLARRINAVVSNLPFAKTSPTRISSAAQSKLSVADLLDDDKRIMKTKSGPQANLANAMEVIRYSLEWDAVLAYNELSEEIVLLKPIPGTRTPKSTFKSRALVDDDFAHAVAWFNRHGFPYIGKQIVIDAMEAVAKETVISPVRHYLENVEKSIGWDPTTHESRLQALFHDYFGAEEKSGVPGADPKYLAAIGVKFMVSAVARALRPGCKVDTMLVLEGPQGAGKSSAARVLAGPDYFSDNLPEMGTKDASEHVRGMWIIEVGELSALQKSLVESIKAFVSRQDEKFRPAYARKKVTYPRRCVFIGTTNQDAYLRDETGNRRFWPVKVGTIELTALKRDRDLLWAEAVYWYRQGKEWHLSPEEETLASEAQADRVSTDVWQDELSKSLEKKTETCIAEAASLLGLTRDKISRADQNRITACLKGLGYERDGKFTSGEYRHSARYVRKT